MIHFVFPPPFSPFHSPYLGGPILAAECASLGVSTACHDLNIRLCDYLFSRRALEDIIQRLDSNYNFSSVQIKRKYRISRDYALYLIDRIDELRNKMTNKESRSIKEIITFKMFFYYFTIIVSNISNFNWSPDPYFLIPKDFDSNTPVSDLIQYIEDIDVNSSDILYQTFKNILIPSLNLQRGDLICISFTGHPQLFSILLLANLIKKSFSFDIPIVIGGPAIRALEESIEFCENIFDYISIIVFGPGEIFFTHFLPLFNNSFNNLNDILLEHGNKIPNLIFRKNSEIIKTKRDFQAEMQTVKQLMSTIPDFKNDFHLYFRKEPAFSLRFSHGCYWNKCVFCSGTDISPICFTLPVREVINQIKYLTKQLNTRVVYITDSAIHPSQLKEFAEELLKNSLDILWVAISRFEPETSELDFNLLHKAGCRIIAFGLESGSQTTLKLMRKGINLRTAEKILKASSLAGIWNHLFLITDFPGVDPIEDAKSSLDFIMKNSEYIDTIDYTPYRMEVGSIMFTRRAYYGIEINDYPITSANLQPPWRFIDADREVNRDSGYKFIHNHFKNTRFNRLYVGGIGAYEFIIPTIPHSLIREQIIKMTEIYSSIAEISENVQNYSFQLIDELDFAPKSQRLYDPRVLTINFLTHKLYYIPESMIELLREPISGEELFSMNFVPEPSSTNPISKEYTIAEHAWFLLQHGFLKAIPIQKNY
ncbi:MAG: B12-binding domain-containing radical SAM protein [Candidatus Helarchaeota archaeon]